jgi:hypothetical protein
VFQTRSKADAPVHSDPALNRYRSLFEQEFGAVKRLFDVSSTGLPLGLATLDTASASRLLRGPSSHTACAARLPDERLVDAFIAHEVLLLSSLKSILTGGEKDASPLASLLGDCDYLWAHFPDRAAVRPPETDQSFLNRVRAEIDPMLRLFGIAQEHA